MCTRIHADTPIHSENGPGAPCSTLGVLSPQDHCAFWLVPVCTIYWVVIYISGSVLPQGETFHPMVWHPSQLLASLGGCQLKQHKWPNLWTVCHIGCDLSHQVWLQEIRRAMIHSHTRRVSNLEQDSFVDLASCRTSGSSNGARIIGVLHIVSLCALYKQSWSHSHQRMCIILLIHLTHSPRHRYLSARALNKRPRGHDYYTYIDNLLYVLYFTVFTGIESIPPSMSDLGVTIIIVYW